MPNRVNKQLKEKTVSLSWSKVDYLSRKLATAVKRSSFSPEVIVGIQRGGCVPAVFLSHLLNVKDFFTFGIRTTVTDDPYATRQPPMVVDDSILSLAAGKSVLLVDDVTNTGATLSIADECLLKHGCKEVKTAVLVWDMSKVKSCKANYYSASVAFWVVFPWEL